MVIIVVAAVVISVVVTLLYFHLWFLPQFFSILFPSPYKNIFFCCCVKKQREKKNMSFFLTGDDGNESRWNFVRWQMKNKNGNMHATLCNATRTKKIYLWSPVDYTLSPRCKQKFFAVCVWCQDAILYFNCMNASLSCLLPTFIMHACLVWKGSKKNVQNCFVCVSSFLLFFWLYTLVFFCKKKIK